MITAIGKTSHNGLDVNYVKANRPKIPTLAPILRISSSHLRKPKQFDGLVKGTKLWTEPWSVGCVKRSTTGILLHLGQSLRSSFGPIARICPIVDMQPQNLRMKMTRNNNG
uniref:Uncharacterized protein n=1 Tax=Cacopsylla melanoneura TaxID=428564 RepID=A0A8D8TMA1_9HEMI